MDRMWSIIIYIQSCIEFHLWASSLSFYRLTWRNNALNNNKCNVLIYYNHQPLFHKKKNNKHIKGSPHLAQMPNVKAPFELHFKYDAAC